MLIVDLETRCLDAAFDATEPIVLGGTFDGTNYELMYGEEKVITRLQQWLDEGETFVFHNAAFDVSVLRSHGLDVSEGRYHCTQVLEHTMCPRAGSEQSLGVLTGLKMDLYTEVIERYFNGNKRSLKKEEVYAWCADNYRRVRGLPSLYCSYLRADLAATHQLWTSQLTRITKEDWEVYTKLNLPYIEVIIDMTTGGVPVTFSEFTETESELRKLVESSYLEMIRVYKPFVPTELKAKPYPNCGMVPFNPSSRGQLLQALKYLYDFKPSKFTSKNNPVLNEEVLEELDYPLVENLLDYNKSKKMLQFIDGLRKIVKSDGRVHPSYNQAGTRTTRLSCSSPNIQNIPARDKRGKMLRSMFRTNDEHRFICGDMSGFQLRILAAYISYYFGDHSLTYCFNNKEDVHQFFADIYGIIRKIAKNVTFGYLFGAGVSKMTSTANRGNPNPITERIIRDALVRLEERFPALPALRKLFVDTARSQGGYIKDWLGQTYYIPEVVSKQRAIRASGERKVFNYMIQGMEASVFRNLQVKARRGTRGHLPSLQQVLAVHDETGYISHVTEADAACIYLNSIYNVPFSTFAPEGDDVGCLTLECEFTVADSWLSAKDA